MRRNGKARPEDLLASLDAAVLAAEGISLRQGGVLFFARDPQRFVKNIRTAYLVDARPQRREVYEYPPVAIREAITNAVMHRDYHYDAAHVFVSIFADRLEVENPGGLFSGLSLADLGKRSVRRNRLVARSPVPRPLRRTRWQWHPEDQAGAAGERQPADGDFGIQLLRGHLSAAAGHRVPPLSARQSRLFHFVAGRTRTTKEEAATFLAVSGDTALRELRALRDAGLVERGGVGKAAFYQRAGHLAE